MNFHATEIEVIRWAEAHGKLTEPTINEQGSGRAALVSTVNDLCDAIAQGEMADVSNAMGRVAIDMIVLCALLDIDLAKCLEQAFNKITAKPADTHNVVFLKS